MNRSRYQWAVVGCGVIANEFAQAMERAGKKIYAVGSRTYERAVNFAKTYGIEHVYEDIDAMIADPDVDIVYVATPHNTHYPYVKSALEQGKHVLCEKAIMLNSEELDEVMALAKEKDLILAEAMTIYHQPLYQKLDEIVNGGRLGDVRMITMNFGSYKEYDMSNRFFNPDLAGGALLDIGVYALSFVRFFLKSQATAIASQVKKAPTGVDEQVGILLTNEEGQMATVALTLHSKQPKRGMISCDKGYVEIMNYPRAMEAVITDTQTGEQTVIKEGDTQNALVYEILHMEETIGEHAEEPDSSRRDRMYLSYSKDVMDIMTRIRREWQVVYPEER